MKFSLCPPAQLYLFVSVFSIFILGIQNMDSTTQYNVGSVTKVVSSSTFFLLFLIKLVVIAFWTFILNLLCKSGYSSLSWFLVLLPYILFIFVIMTL